MSTTNLGSRPISAPGEAGGAAVASRRPRRRIRRVSGWRRVISPVALLVVWQLSSALHLISSQKLPPPTAVVSKAYNLVTISQTEFGGTLQHAMLISLERMAIGFAVGAAVALLCAVVAGLSRVGEEAIDPIMQMLRTLPLFGLIPVFIVWFGIGQLPKILLVALGATIPLYLNAFSGIRGVDGRLGELGRSLGLSRWETLVHIILPGALPETLVGLRQSLGVAWLALVVAEQINANSGLGYMINQATQFSENNVIIVALLVYTILGLITDWMVRILERRTLSWRQGLVASR